MSGNDGSQSDDLETRARNSNSTLQSLIDAIGGLIVGSRELLARLQRHISDEPVSDPGPAPDCDRPPERPGDKPPNAQHGRFTSWPGEN